MNSDMNARPRKSAVEAAPARCCVRKRLTQRRSLTRRAIAVLQTMVFAKALSNVSAGEERKEHVQYSILRWGDGSYIGLET